MDRIPNFLKISECLGTAGQPMPEQFAIIAAAGYEAVINLAMPDSTHALPNEAELVREQGLEYVHIPVVWEAPTLADMERFLTVMELYRGRKVLVHCAMNMRVSCFVLLYRVVKEGAPLRKAMEAVYRIWQPDEVWQAFIERSLAHYGHRSAAVVLAGPDLGPGRRKETTVEYKSVVRPRLAVLDPEQVQQVHNDSVHILASIGVRVDSPRARQLFARATGRGVAVEGDRVSLSRQVIEWAVEVAPRSVRIYDRRGNVAFDLPGPARFGMGVTSLYYQDPLSEEVTPFARQHMSQLTRLGQALPSFDVISTLGIVQDVPAEVSDLYATLEMVANTVKPLVVLISADEAFPVVLDLLEHLHGDLAARPFVVPYLNPITPLVINRGTLGKMFVCAERGLPFIYSNYGMAGASTPITPAASLVLLNAELLAGLVLSQLMQEGTPVILGSLPAFFDMRGMGSFYDPQSYLMDLACAEMMAHYRLPHCGTSGSGMGWGADLIASGHQWFNHLISCMGKVGLVPFIGDNLGAKAYSPAVAVYANEIIAQARLFADGFPLDGDALALGEIAQVGPGGDFLTTKSTLKRLRRAYYQSPIFANLTLEEWQARGRPQAGSLLRQHTARLLREAPAPEDQEQVLARGRAFIESRG
jgi:trimethylamine--corrinoid protein Co-methyltransferase